MVRRSLDKLPVCEVLAVENTTHSRVWHDNGCREGMEEIPIDCNAVEGYRLVHLVTCPPILARRLASTNASLSFEPGPMIFIDESYLDPEVINRSSIIFFNEEEFNLAIKISGISSPEDFIKGTDRKLVVTKGSNGSVIYYRDGNNYANVTVSAAKLDNEIVDHTGAGDCYKAGFLAGHLRGLPLRKCAEIGSEMGAQCVIQQGGILPDDFVRKVKIRHSF